MDKPVIFIIFLILKKGFTPELLQQIFLLLQVFCDIEYFYNKNLRNKLAVGRNLCNI